MTVAVQMQKQPSEPVTIDEKPIRKIWRKRVYYTSKCGYPGCKVKFGAWSAELLVQNKEGHERKHLSDDVKKAKRKELERSIR